MKTIFVANNNFVSKVMLALNAAGAFLIMSAAQLQCFFEEILGMP